MMASSAPLSANRDWSKLLGENGPIIRLAPVKLNLDCSDFKIGAVLADLIPASDGAFDSV